MARPRSQDANGFTSPGSQVGGRVGPWTRARLAGRASAVVDRTIGRLRPRNGVRSDPFRVALDALLDDVAIARAIRDADGTIVDFELEFVNAASVDGAGRSADEMIGASVLELYPNWRDSGMFDRFVRVVETGEPVVVDREHYADDLDDGTTIDGYWSMQVTQFGDGYLAASRDVTAAVLAERDAEENRRIAERERTAVELLQRAALPVRLPEIDGLAVGALYRPTMSGQPIGGDWYDIFEIDDDLVGLVIADVAGHGPDAASFMVQVRNIVRALALEHTDPDAVLAQVNRVTLSLAGTEARFVTCCYATLDTRTRRFSWARAGHLDPLVVSADGVAHYPRSHAGLPLAVMHDASYRTASIVLAPGDRVLLFTDGLVERRGEHLDIGLDRVARAAESCNESDPASCASSLLSVVDDQFDDLAVLCLDIHR